MKTSLIMLTVNLTRLSVCSYIQENHNVIIMGATGVGKTYFSCALGNAASRNLFTVKHTRLPDLFSDLALARSEGTYRKMLKHYMSAKLLILDDWLLYPLSD